MAAQCNIPNSYCSALFTSGSFLSFHQQTSTATLTLLVQQPPIPTTTQATTTTLYRKDPQKCEDKKCVLILWWWRKQCWDVEHPVGRLQKVQRATLGVVLMMGRLWKGDFFNGCLCFWCCVVLGRCWKGGARLRFTTSSGSGVGRSFMARCKR